MARRTISLIVVSILILVSSQDPCDARRVERQRGSRYRTRSLIQNSSGKGKVGGKADGKADGKGVKKDKPHSYYTELDNAQAKVTRADGKASKKDKSHSYIELNDVQKQVTKKAHQKGKIGKKDKPHSHIDLDNVQTQVPIDESKYSSKGSLYSPLSKPSTSSVSTPIESLVPLQNPTEPKISSSPPSATRSVGPSKDPTSSPSAFPSGAPSESPIKSPSQSPSESPSGVPSRSPSGKSSELPTSSSAVVVEHGSSSGSTEYSTTTAGDGSGIESYCVNPEPSETDGGNFNEDQILVFQYLLFIPENIQETGAVVTDMEECIHEGLSKQFLTCKIISQESRDQHEYPFRVWSISSKPPDGVVPERCENIISEPTIPSTPSGSKCMVVQAELKMEVYFPPSRVRRHMKSRRSRVLKPVSTTSADLQVIAASGAYLNSSMSKGAFDDCSSVLQTHFLAFIMEGDIHTSTINRVETNIAGANAQAQNGNEDSGVVAGAMTMAAAAVCLVAVALISLRRRKQRSEDYLNRVDNLSTFSDLDKDAFDRATFIVGDGDDNSLDWFIDDGQDMNGRQLVIQPLSLDYQQDVHKCASAYCNCHRQNTRPTFIPSNILNGPDILEDLRCEFSVLEERSYGSPDTVNL
mmetsp:Transcript_5015/g.11158  ORF Transcript_5015/g.11158 Transcript_5015/m.11158 type:complete len:638 (-) Transcript_5015:191-2104(-)